VATLIAMVKPNAVLSATIIQVYPSYLCHEVNVFPFYGKRFSICFGTLEG